ncbi:hypothetical protein BABINDRAFT_165782 [Babjeviella inositovora NRRL Y-12698]|uniref:NECAP PHear domain-containing protein n=1 Tax=Babjeviella inositovora NRRL Y-12698 TaxID=984486 RepID=A0A1E3QTP7_9ASCO|nr:uncharacterized protein BABINDRAFT_165782 [Babjeviella inositovora NRRL Y-12698]ODQ81063.1 hypothetical protein BABINDRAFT_165782 [Babjeviella inositovora NRRL Y-12698]
MNLNGNILDTVAYTTSEASLFAIPPPRKAANGEYVHNIFQWDLAKQPLWRGEMRVIEREDFGSDSTTEPLVLKLDFLDDGVLWASLLGEQNLLATRSTKLYVVLVNFNDVKVGLGLQLKDSTQANEFALALQDYRSQQAKMKFYAKPDASTDQDMDSDDFGDFVS